MGGGAAGGSSNQANSGAVIPSEARNLNRETLSTNTGITHLYPIYDEAAAGSLQAVLNTTGEIVSRNFAEGAYGEDEYAFGGAAVDRIAVHATKDDQGNVASVEVTLRTTESLKSSTLAAGLRLAAVAKDGEVVRSVNAVPTLFDNNDATAVWKLTASEWNALVDPAAVTVGTKTLTPAALSIAATSELRAKAWGDVPVLAAPDWALQSKPVFTSATLPVEVRESLANLSQWLSSIPAKSDRTQPLYEVDDLAALGIARTFGGSSRESAGDPAQLLLGAAFHAQPFAEPVTGKNYVRARWYDPTTGTWLTPDPFGYRDSSNMYAFAGGDPVNQSDPAGTQMVPPLCPPGQTCMRAAQSRVPTMREAGPVRNASGLPLGSRWQLLSGTAKTFVNGMIGIGYQYQYGPADAGQFFPALSDHDPSGYFFAPTSVREQHAMQAADAVFALLAFREAAAQIRHPRSTGLGPRDVKSLDVKAYRRGYQVEDVRQAETYKQSNYERSVPFARVVDFTDRAGIEKVELKSLDVTAKTYQVNNVAESDLQKTLERYRSQLEGYEKANSTPFNVLEIQLLNAEKLTFAQDQVFRNFVQQSVNRGILVEVHDYATGHVLIAPTKE